MEPKPLDKLNEKEFNSLKKSGLLQSIYPDAPADFKKIKGKRPSPIENPDFSDLIRTTESMLNDIENGKYHEDSDDDHYIYESALDCVYGKGIWDYINKNR